MKTEQVINWLTSEAMRNTTYHNHKENMAWVATALYLTGSIVGGIQLGCANGYENCMAIILFIILTLIAFTFINWQFSKRWIAADKVEGLLRTIAEIPSLKSLTTINWTIDEKYLLPNFVVNNIKTRISPDRIITLLLSNIAMLIGLIFFIARVFC